MNHRVLGHAWASLHRRVYPFASYFQRRRAFRLHSRPDTLCTCARHVPRRQNRSRARRSQKVTGVRPPTHFAMFTTNTRLQAHIPPPASKRYPLADAQPTDKYYIQAATARDKRLPEAPAAPAHRDPPVPAKAAKVPPPTPPKVIVGRGHGGRYRRIGFLGEVRWPWHVLERLYNYKKTDANNNTGRFCTRLGGRRRQ